MSCKTSMFYSTATDVVIVTNDPVMQGGLILHFHLKSEYLSVIDKLPSQLSHLPEVYQCDEGILITVFLLMLSFY